MQAHPFLSPSQREELCNVIDYQKLSIDACAHASQNERLPLRVVLQVLFFEQMQLRTALAGCLHALDTESALTSSVAAPADLTGQIIQRDRWVTIVRDNQVLKVDMEKMRSRVGQLEQEFSTMKEEMKKVAKSHNSNTSARTIGWRIGCKLLPHTPDAQSDIVESIVPSPRASVELRRPARGSRHMKSFSLF